MIMNYKSKILSLEKIIEAYRSSEKFEEQRQFFKKRLKEKDMEINKLKKQIEQDSIFHKKSNRDWRAACDEIYNDCKNLLSENEKKIKALEEQLRNSYLEINTVYDDKGKQKTAIIRLEKKLDEERARNVKLNAQVNKDYENSGKPSSMDGFHKKIENGRIKSGRKQGAQPGHQSNGRKKYKPTNGITIESPSEYLDTSKYKATGKMLKKQVVNMTLVVQVDEYQTQEFRCLASRQKVHAPFPKGVTNEVNFGASVQAMAFLLNNHYNVSIAKTSSFLNEASRGVFSISTGCINSLVKKFANKTKDYQDKIFDHLVKAPVMNTDFTPVRVNGKIAQTLICNTKDAMMFYAREHKGHKGIEKSPVAYTTKTLIHDHEIAFYSYGGNHQECLVHVLRYIKGSMENEKNLSWNKRMYETIKKMMHYANSEIKDVEEVRKLTKEYDKNLEIAELNYKEHPPNKYYRDGFNLAKRMKEYRGSHLLFLEEGIPFDNNRCERSARVMKRKLKQAMTFRSVATFEATCASLGVIESLRIQGGNLFEKVIDIFDMKNGQPENA